LRVDTNDFVDVFLGDTLGSVMVPPPGYAPVVYPSMNPTRLGAIPEEVKQKQRDDHSQTQPIPPSAPPGFPYRMQTTSLSLTPIL
jgi:hypothetical protein